MEINRGKRISPGSSAADDLLLNSSYSYSYFPFINSVEGVNWVSKPTFSLKV